MPTAIEKIQAKAKALRKSYPNAKWTDLIKKASTELKKIGSIGATSKKKKATKKAATKKAVSKRKPKVVKVLKQHGTSARAYDKRHQALPAGRRISKSGRPYTETRSNRSDKGVLLGVHKDTKSHNVRISVMSGVNKKDIVFKLDNIIKDIEYQENRIYAWKKMKKEYLKEISLTNYNLNLKSLQNQLKVLKKHKMELKKLL
jgi:hypothetical protein